MAVPLLEHPRYSPVPDLPNPDGRCRHVWLQYVCSSTLRWIRANPPQTAIPTKNCATDGCSSPPSLHSIGITTHMVLSLRNLIDGTVSQMRRALRLRPDIRCCHTGYVSWEEWPKNTHISDGSTRSLPMLLLMVSLPYVPCSTSSAMNRSSSTLTDSG